LAQSYVVIEIYTREGARSDGKTLSEAVLEYVRKLKAPARLVVFKGTEGCYENGEISTQKIVDLSANQPIKMEIVLPSVEADAIMADLQEMVSDGILGSRPLTVFSHRTQKRLFPPQTRVRDVMTREPVAVPLDAPADRVMKALLSARFTGVPVVDAENRPVGVVSQSDLIYRAGMPVRLALMAQSDPERLKSVVNGLAAKTAADIMTAPPITIEENEPLTQAVNAMVKNKVKRLPVVNGEGFLTGIVSRLDVFQTITREAPDWERLQKHHVLIENSHYVSDIMRRDTHMVSPDTPVHEVLSIIDDNDIQRVAVVDEEGHLLGLISDRTLLSAFSEKAPGVWEVLSRLSPFSGKPKHLGNVREKMGNQPAEAVMKTDLNTIRENTGIDEAIALMTEHGIKRLPVVDDQGIFKGMISREALLKQGFSAMKSLMAPTQ
jgi:CBS domain-containing protein